MKSIIYIGMDVHKNSYSLCAYDGLTGEILGEVKCGADVKNIEKFIRRIRSKYEDTVDILTGYEAGCLGYFLYHQLVDKGIACDILAPTTMQRSSKDKLNKNDKLDARSIAQNLANGTYRKVYVPNDKDVEIKEYIRMMEDFKLERKKVKQHINALTLRHGQKYEGKSRWTIAHIKWLKSLELSDLLREVLDEYLNEYDTLNDKIERFKEKLIEMSKEEVYEKPISQLKCLKGIDVTSAMTVHVEISDFNRFPTAKAFASYVGLTPGQASSGDKVTYLSITKQGNSTVRRLLVECAQALVKGTAGSKSKALKARQKGQSQETIKYADKAAERLQRKFNKMIYRGVNRNKAVTAIARELACFIWGMETGNIN
ncbi:MULTISPECIES: IS110 family transposase [Breznakia]|uniref:Transposase n=1 Tax=Breznakia blatticola TaxID=1754012 RepID=A0A4R7ZA05_9FIRM|nr:MULTISPECIES: IS110 family transposase [Breznakia]MDH6366898.1 transposase [Breznakia sp. PH1-1]MDH6404076.1 transposase [Breznakia sp. PF1-11]MDH6411702.1 transposase [Breznakia sp. PFB1-11]MDH6414064.1 transposase [Breznakia sp. PFB1-14]MDH6416494.1 transposase [Breznakia sp. PFB1-4]